MAFRSLTSSVPVTMFVLVDNEELNRELEMVVSSSKSIQIGT